MGLTQISTAGVKDDAVTASKVPADAVGASELADNAVDTAAIAADAVTGAKIADDAINSEHYTDGSIDTAHIADSQVTTAKIAADAITAAKIADDVINSEHIAAGAVDLEHMSSESVDEDNLHISNAGTNGQYLQKQSGNSGGLTWADVSSTDTLSHRNLIINGAMQVWQRGTSSTSDGYSTADMWKTSYGGENEDPTFSQQDLTSSDTGPWEKGFRHALKVTNGNQTSTDADDYLIISQRFESQTLGCSGWNYTSASSYITLSFWVRSSVAQNFYGYLRTEDGTGQLYPFETGSLSANTWTKITKSIPGHANVQFDTDTHANSIARAAILDIWPFGGTDYSASPTLNTWANYSSGARFPANTATWWTTDNATFAITGVQLEVGDTATTFEHRSYADELARCQRYYTVLLKGNGGSDGTGNAQLSVGYVASSSVIIGCAQLPVQMRATPSIDHTSGTSYWEFTGGGTTTNISSALQASSQNNISWGYAFTGATGLTAGHAGRFSRNNDDIADRIFAATAEL